MGYSFHFSSYYRLPVYFGSWPPSFYNQWWLAKPFLCHFTLELTLLSSLPMFKDPYDYTGPTGIVFLFCDRSDGARLHRSGSLATSGSLTLLTSVKSSLQCMMTYAQALGIGMQTSLQGGIALHTTVRIPKNDSGPWAWLIVDSSSSKFHCSDGEKARSPHRRHTDFSLHSFGLVGP